MAKFWKIQASSTNPRSGDLYLYGPISESTWWGDEVTPKQFAEDLKALGDIDELHVRINSGGGDVFAGQAIYSLLKSQKAKVIVHVDGLAASIASVIAMAGDTVIMPRNATMMVHNPAALGWGNAEELRSLADVLDKIREGLIAAYQSKTGMDREDLIALLDMETWLTADEAKEFGFVDEVEDLQVAASVKAGVLNLNGTRFDLSQFRVKPPFAEATPNPPNKPKGRSETMEITAKVVAEQSPAVHQEIKDSGRQEGIAAERARLKALSDLAVPGNAEVAQIINVAVEAGDSAEATALKVVAAVKRGGTSAPQNPAQAANPLQNMIQDAAALNGLNNPPMPTATDDAERTKAANTMAEAANSRRK